MSHWKSGLWSRREKGEECISLMLTRENSVDALTKPGHNVSRPSLQAHIAYR
jgi:hypothetical protein